MVAAEVGGVKRPEGAFPLKQPLQEIYGGIYFPIPAPLVPYLVPQGDVGNSHRTSLRLDRHENGEALDALARLLRTMCIRHNLLSSRFVGRQVGGTEIAGFSSRLGVGAGGPQRGWGQRHAASLPRVSGPLQEERPNKDVGARRPRSASTDLAKESTGSVSSAGVESTFGSTRPG